MAELLRLAEELPSDGALWLADELDASVALDEALLAASELEELASAELALDASLLEASDELVASELASLLEELLSDW